MYRASILMSDKMSSHLFGTVCGIWDEEIPYLCEYQMHLVKAGWLDLVLSTGLADLRMMTSLNSAE